MNAPLPGVPESIGPLSGVTVLLVPDVLFRPEPASLPQGKNQFDDVGVSFAIHSLFFDIKDK